MRSFAIDEPGSSVRALYATLPPITIQDLEVSPEKHFENGIEVGKWSTTYVWSKIREKIDKTDWKRHDQPAIVNAFYSPLENSIQFPAGILQGNFFGADRPAYMNYGAIGWVRTLVVIRPTRLYSTFRGKRNIA